MERLRKSQEGKIAMPIVVKFPTELLPRDDMPPLERDVITFEQPSGEVSARVSTEQDAAPKSASKS